MLDNELRKAARELLEALDGNVYPTHKVIDSSVIRERRDALRAALSTPEPKLAEKLWGGIGAECAINDYLDDHLPNDSWDRIWWDNYDASLELGGCNPDLRLSPEVQAWLWMQGFARCWLNHVNDTQTYYTPDSTNGHTYKQPEHSKERGQRKSKPADPTEPIREPTQEQVDAWTRQASSIGCIDELSGDAIIEFAALAHAAGYEAGRMAGGKDAERLDHVQTIVEETGECWFQLIRAHDDRALYQLCTSYDDVEPLRYDSIRAAIDAAMQEPK